MSLSPEEGRVKSTQTEFRLDGKGECGGDVDADGWWLRWL